MQDDSDGTRNVIPRWHPLPATERLDLASVKAVNNDLLSRGVARLTDSVSLWRDEDGIAAAADLLDAYLITGDRRTLIHAISKMRQNKADIPPRLRDTLFSIFRPIQAPQSWRRQIAQIEAEEANVRRSISVLKRHIASYPRNGLYHVELSRLYSILGVYSKAESHMRIALSLSPNNRYVLRSMVQFYDIVGDLFCGVKQLRQSDIIKFDPWIQSAEIAATTMLGKSSLVASHNLIEIGKNGNIPRKFSELAMAIASLDRLAGVKERKVFQLVKSALPNSTENGFAQAIWLSDRSSREFVKRFPDAEPSEDAFEAMVRLKMKDGDFEGAAESAEAWLEDQPFSVDAMITLLNLRAVHVSPNDNAQIYARRALTIHSDNWHVMNACALLFTECSDFQNASLALSRIERIATNEDVGPFLPAGRGFLAFALGDFLGGRRYYEDAIKLAKSQQNNFLTLNAIIFWFRSEVGNSLMSVECIRSMISLIDRSIPRIVSTDRQVISDVWNAVKRYIEGKESQGKQNDGDAIAETASAYIDDPILF